MTNEDAWFQLKLHRWVGRVELEMLAVEAQGRQMLATVKAKAKAVAKAKAQHKAEAKAQPKAKAKAKGKALPKAQPKAMLKTVAKAQGKAQGQAKATAKAKAAPQVMAQLHAHALQQAMAMAISAPGSPCSNSSTATTLVLGGFLPVPDSPVLGSISHGSSSRSLGFYRGRSL